MSKVIKTFDDYQDAAKTTAMYLNKVKEAYPELPTEILKVLGISYAANGLGEVGEVQGKVKKIIRDAGGVISEETKLEISKEIGDVMWYIMAICEEFDLRMEDVAQQNYDKLISRKKRGMIGGNGDNR
jgi:NTP pyrophosphatase (non-canonical NTP hydrolase)